MSQTSCIILNWTLSSTEDMVWLMCPTFYLFLNWTLSAEDMAWLLSHTSYLILNWTLSAEDMAWLMSHTLPT